MERPWGSFKQYTHNQEVTVSLMSQFHPMYRADEAEGLNRRLTNNEYQQAVDLLEELGLENGWVQEDPGN